MPVRRDYAKSHERSRRVGALGVVFLVLAGLITLVNRPVQQVDPGLPGWRAPELIPSTRPFPLSGGAYIPVLKDGELALVTDVAVVATVLAVYRPVANTTTGRVPEIRADRSAQQLDSILPVISVDIRIDEVLGRRPESALLFVPGETVTLSISGGWIDMVLDASGIEALEILDVPPGVEEGPGAVEVMERPAAPYPFRITLDPSTYLETGETAVLFLASQSVPRFNAADMILPPVDREIVTVTYGDQGVFRLADAANIPGEVRAAAALLATLSGPAVLVDEIER